MAGVRLCRLSCCSLYLLVLREGRGLTHASRRTRRGRSREDNEALEGARAPTIRVYPIEVIFHLNNSLPSPDVRITVFNQSARQISVDGEANSAALAYQFADKVKKNPDLQTFQFELGAPRILPNDHAQFRLEGKPR